jgi:TrmH family RNA methyltransferase
MLDKQKLKYIQSLGQKKFRRQEELFVAEGQKIVNELLETDATHIEEVYALKDWITANEKLLKHVRVFEVKDFELEKMSQLSAPNKVLAVVRQFPQHAGVLTKGRVTLALDTIQDPGNMGTIIRLADWFGIDQVVCSIDCADIYNSKVVQSTMGSIARVRVLYTDLEKWLTEQDITIYATAPAGTDATKVKKLQEGIIVIGNESKGIDPAIIQLAKMTISIPRKGRAESLNAAVAAGIILSHVLL